MAKATFQVYRGNAAGGKFENYSIGISDGMVVLDAVLQIQAELANDLAVRVRGPDAPWTPGRKAQCAMRMEDTTKWSSQCCGANQPMNAFAHTRTAASLSLN